jgi:hypothetical protein
MDNCTEKNFFQTEWLGVRFDDLHIDLDESNLPANEFYNKFYSFFF